LLLRLLPLGCVLHKQPFQSSIGRLARQHDAVWAHNLWLVSRYFSGYYLLLVIIIMITIIIIVITDKW